MWLRNASLVPLLLVSTLAGCCLDPNNVLCDSRPIVDISDPRCADGVGGSVRCAVDGKVISDPDGEVERARILEARRARGL